jgi:hypothetical protein
MLDVPAAVHADGPPTVNDVFVHRTGDPEEKSYAFVALLQRYGLDPDILWAHDPDLGRFRENYPAWGQINIPLVRVVFDDRVRWYDLGCDTCRPGEIRPKLRDRQALYTRRDAVARHEALVDLAVEWAYRKERDLPVVYLEMIDDEQWYEWVATPGLMSNVAAMTKYTMDFGRDDTDRVRLLVESTGPTPVRRAAHAVRDAGLTVSDWVGDKFEDSGSVEVLEVSEVGADTLRVSLQVEGFPVPPIVDGSWVLPAPLIYGEPAVLPWPAERKSPFQIGSDMVREWEARFALPEDWSRFKLPEDAVVGTGVLRYARRVSVEDGELVIRRVLAEKKCRITDPEALALIGLQVQMIYELETMPVVLHLEEW